MGLPAGSFPCRMLPPAHCFWCLPPQVLALSPEAGCRASTSSSGHRGLLWRLRERQSRLGLFEVGPEHELHPLTCMMQAGLWAAIQVSMDHPPTVSGQSLPCTSTALTARPGCCPVPLMLQGWGSEQARSGGRQGLCAGREGHSWVGAEARKP